MYPVRYCPKHGNKMTLLFVSYVCDVCEPPKVSAPAVHTFDGELAARVARIPWREVGFGGKEPNVLQPRPRLGGLALAYEADLVIQLNRPSSPLQWPRITLLKNRWGPNNTEIIVSQRVWDDLDFIAHTRFGDPFTGLVGERRLLFVADGRR